MHTHVPVKESHINSTLGTFVSIMEGTVLRNQGFLKSLNTDSKPITSELMFTGILILTLIELLGYASTIFKNVTCMDRLNPHNNLII